MVKKMLSQMRRSLGITDIANDLHATRDILTQKYIADELNNNPRYKNQQHLNRYELKVFSQFGEDGIIWEIFRRIGTTNRYFVEIGVEAGENNTLHLLLNGWQGSWIDGSEKLVQEVNDSIGTLIEQKKLSVMSSFITKENVGELFASLKVPKELDFLSIDIDGNDYWILTVLKKFSPRVICTEYNAFFGPEAKWIMPYDPAYIHAGSIHYGASLSAFEQLLKKEYSLVACSFAGTNAFFVRNDLVKRKFLKPFTAQNFFQPARLYLYQKLAYPVLAKALQSF